MIQTPTTEFTKAKECGCFQFILRKGFEEQTVNTDHNYTISFTLHRGNEVICSLGSFNKVTRLNATRSHLLKNATVSERDMQADGEVSGGGTLINFDEAVVSSLAVGYDYASQDPPVTGKIDFGFSGTEEPGMCLGAIMGNESTFNNKWQGTLQESLTFTNTKLLHVNVIDDVVATHSDNVAVEVANGTSSSPVGWGNVNLDGGYKVDFTDDVGFRNYTPTFSIENNASDIIIKGESHIKINPTPAVPYTDPVNIAGSYMPYGIVEDWEPVYIGNGDIDIGPGDGQEIGLSKWMFPDADTRAEYNFVNDIIEAAKVAPSGADLASDYIKQSLLNGARTILKPLSSISSGGSRIIDSETGKHYIMVAYEGGTKLYEVSNNVLEDKTPENIDVCYSICPI
jgi:hypothetical protein